MKSVRIYKDDIRVHILRSLFFTDTMIAVSVGAILAGLIFIFFQYFLHVFNWSYFISTVIVTEIFFIALVTQKIDNQAIYKIVPRGITFKTTKKEHRHNDLEPYFVDFAIQDTCIIRKNTIVKMYEVEPFDIALLNDQDREHFFIKLKQMIHLLSSQVQFIVKKEKANIQDYSKHLSRLYDDSNTKREPLIDRYIHDISDLIQNNAFTITRHYAVFSVPCNTEKPYEKVKAIKKLNDIAIRFSSAVVACNISVKPLDTTELISFAQSTLR